MSKIVLFFALVPCVGYVIYMYATIYRQTVTRRESRDDKRAALAHIGGGSIRFLGRLGSPSTSGSPTFVIRDLEYKELGPGYWQLKPRVLLHNTSPREILLDDVHVIIYVEISSVPPLATISYHGTSVILQDNTLLKEEGRPYSLAPGDGFEMDLVIEATRLEGAPSYYPVTPKRGACCFLFGLIADYSRLDPHTSDESNVTTPSLCMFLCRSEKEEPEFIEVDNRVAETFPWPLRGYNLEPLQAILSRHSRYRPRRR